MELREVDAVVAVLAFVSGDHDVGIVGEALHSFLHQAAAVGASIVAPAEQRGAAQLRYLLLIFSLPCILKFLASFWNQNIVRPNSCPRT